MKTIALLTMAHALVKFLSWREERRLSRTRLHRRKRAVAGPPGGPRDHVLRHADDAEQADRRTLDNYVSPLY